jgi:prepilin-type processing-associated H-X9-DG protein
LPYIEQDNIGKAYVYNVDFGDPLNTAALKLPVPVFRCPSNPGADMTPTPYTTNYISGGNDSFAPPSSPGSSKNIFGGGVYTPSTNVGVNGWLADYAALCQVKTIKDPNGAEIGYANSLVANAYSAGTLPSKGAMRQNGITRIIEIRDGTSNTTLFSEAAGRDVVRYADGSTLTNTSNTGPIWADSDNRLTVTGSNADGKGGYGTGPCAMNCTNLQGDIFSFHPGGANVGFADGSVRFISQNINIATLAALVTKNGGEIIPSDL